MNSTWNCNNAYNLVLKLGSNDRHLIIVFRFSFSSYLGHNVSNERTELPLKITRGNKKGSNWEWHNLSGKPKGMRVQAQFVPSLIKSHGFTTYCSVHTIRESSCPPYYPWSKITTAQDSTYAPLGFDGDDDDVNDDKQLRHLRCKIEHSKCALLMKQVSNEPWM